METRGRIVIPNDFFNWLFDLHQSEQIVETKAAQSETRGRVTDIDDDRRDLERRYERLRLVTMAMWALLKEHSGLSESDLRRFVNQVDLIDGKLDGKLSRDKGIIDCTKCQRRILRSSLTCVYCGEQNRQGSSFHGT
jgi:hypothetical protein